MIFNYHVYALHRNIYTHKYLFSQKVVINKAYTYSSQVAFLCEHVIDIYYREY